MGHLQQDWDVMIAKGDITRCVGDAICLVVAENETVLKQAKELVKVDYEPLEPVRTIQEARAADAPILHPGGNLCQQRHVTGATPGPPWPSPSMSSPSPTAPHSPSTPSWSRSAPWPSPTRTG
ncbi:hypothetical protein M5E87_12870 [Flavonifractor plautii]|nr:hypothetical protein M5E87_12870 [Flavonifractor plautii]